MLGSLQSIGAIGKTPIGSRHVGPPAHKHVVLAQNVDRDVFIGRGENNGASFRRIFVKFSTGRCKLFRRHAPHLLGKNLLKRRPALGNRFIFRQLGKFLKLLVGHLVFAHPEAVQLHYMRRGFILFAGIRAHGKLPAGNPH